MPVEIVSIPVTGPKATPQMRAIWEAGGEWKQIMDDLRTVQTNARERLDALLSDRFEIKADVLVDSAEGQFWNLILYRPNMLTRMPEESDLEWAARATRAVFGGSDE